MFEQNHYRKRQQSLSKQPFSQELILTGSKWPPAGLQYVNVVRYWKSFQLYFSRALGVSTTAQLACGYSALRVPILIAHCSRVYLNDSCLLLNEGQSSSNVCKYAISHSMGINAMNAYNIPQNIFRKNHLVHMKCL